MSNLQAKERLTKNIITAEVTNCEKIAQGMANTMVDCMSSEALNNSQHRIWDIKTLIRKYANRRDWGEQATKEAIIENPALLLHYCGIASIPESSIRNFRKKTPAISPKGTTKPQGRPEKPLPSDEEFIACVEAFHKTYKRCPKASDSRDGAPEGHSWGTILPKFSKKNLTPREVLKMTDNFSQAADDVPQVPEKKPEEKKSSAPNTANPMVDGLFQKKTY